MSGFGGSGSNNSLTPGRSFDAPKYLYPFQIQKNASIVHFEKHLIKYFKILQLCLGIFGVGVRKSPYGETRPGSKLPIAANF